MIQHRDPIPGIQKTDLTHAYQNHSTRWKDHLYVYPVVSRRAGGLSVGINLTPHQDCNFNCLYCQVDRRGPSPMKNVYLRLLEFELRHLLEICLDGSLFLHEPFRALPEKRRQLMTIAFSGDGEPSLSEFFMRAVSLVEKLKVEMNLTQVPTVVMTNTTGLLRPMNRKALEVLDQHGGEIWAKLDAGTEEYYQRVNRTYVPFERILKNIEAISQERFIRIQSLFFKQDGMGPPGDEIDAYAGRLKSLVEHGAHIREVQLYSVARPTNERGVGSLHPRDLEQIADVVQRVTPLTARVY